MINNNNKLIMAIFNQTFWIHQGACSSDQEDLVGLLNDTGITPTVVKSVLNFHRAVVQDPELNSDVASLVRACRLIGDRMKSVDESKTSVSDKKRILGDAFNLAYVNGCHDNRLKEVKGFFRFARTPNSFSKTAFCFSETRKVGRLRALRTLFSLRTDDRHSAPWNRCVDEKHQPGHARQSLRSRQKDSLFVGRYVCF